MYLPMYLDDFLLQSLSHIHRYANLFSCIPPNKMDAFFISLSTANLIWNAFGDDLSRNCYSTSSASKRNLLDSTSTYLYYSCSVNGMYIVCNICYGVNVILAIGRTI